ncbi:Dihydrofolate reductase [Bacillus mojavensis]|uniref:Dihydrofolate reductase n=1 Tax=Bacillus mojavensis TaxID=72360 RepID=A0ABX6M1X8_BACMO|nr:Dihydrofolate reductase [Bacillus mojavensis]
MKEDAIDDSIITVIPVVIGTGIPLFHEQNTETKLGLPI